MLCLAALALLLAHQAFAVGDRRDGANEAPVIAGMVSFGLSAAEADVGGATTRSTSPCASISSRVTYVATP